MDFTQFNNPAVLLVVIPGILIALNSFLKSMGMDSKFAPLVNLVLGVLFSFFPLRELGLNLIPAILGGLIVGLSAGGFYDLKKSVE